MRRLLTTPLLLALLAPARVATAQSPSSGADVALQVTVAKALLEEGKKLLAAGRLAEAKEKLEASIRNDPSPAALIELGTYHEMVGTTASAWGTFHRAEERARMLGDTASAEQASRRAAAIEPTLSRLKIEVTSTRAPLEITLDGRPFSKDAWGTAVPLDPGAHEVVARSPGKQSFFKTVELPAGGHTTVLGVPELTPLVKPRSPDARPTRPSPAEIPPSTPPKRPSPPSNAGLVTLITVTSLGLASGLTGYIILMCNPKSDAVQKAGWITFFSGGALLIPGIVVFALVKTSNKKILRNPIPLQVSPFVAHNGVGLSLQATW
jgi:hypothetical protein